MNILLTGEEGRMQEVIDKFKDNSDINLEKSMGGEDEDYASYDVIMDLNFDDQNENLAYYSGLKDKPVLVSAVKQQLAEANYLFDEKIRCHLIGINALPTFLNRPKWELSVSENFQADKVRSLMSDLKVEYHMVADRVGMVTPRIILMIINEACYTLQEGTATIKDIDLGMKLGTNYPRGPFEWADAIGITDVFETLASIYEDTKDERYKVCPLLKTHYLKNKSFYKNR